MGGLLGGIGGGALGALGGFFGASARQRAMDQFRRRQQTGITRAREITEERVSELLDNPLIREANAFLLDTFQGGSNAATEQFQKNLRVAQETRGLRRSVAGAGAEAGAMAAFLHNQRAALLPQAQSFGTLGERFRQSIFAQETPINIGFETGGAIPGVSQFTPDILDPTGFDPLASAFQGFAGGGAAGFQVGQQFDFNAQQEADRADFLSALRNAPGTSGGNQSFINSLGFI